MNTLHEVVMNENSSQADKDKADKRMNEIKQLTKSTSQISDEKRNKIKGQIDSIGEVMKELRETNIVPIVSVGTDLENQSVEVSVLKDGITDQKIEKYEKELRKIIGDEVDLTITYADPIMLSACSQTGDCNPLKGGVKIKVENGLYCSSGYKATWNTKTGFVTAGHCNSGDIGGTGEKVGNPAQNSSDDLGVVDANGFRDRTWCDCLFVDATETISSLVYPSRTLSGTLYPVDDWRWWWNCF